MYNVLIDGIVGIWKGINMCAAKRLSETERKQEIMDAAARIISSKGLEKTTMEDIIAGTTLSKGGVYHYYGSVIEIFKDIMLRGIEYRETVIKQHLHGEKQPVVTRDFIARELVNKMLDDNPYMPLYIELLIAKKRNPELSDLMSELKEKTKTRLNFLTRDVPEWLDDPNIFEFITNFINAIILASDVLEARENLARNRHILEKMILNIMDENV